MTDLVVTTFFWKDGARRRDYEFTPDHIRILRNMVERHLHIPHRFVCVTNEDIGNEIETVPLDMEKHVPGTVFARLMLRRPDIGDILGAKRILNLDLDLVIVDDIGPIVDRPEPCVWWRNPNWPMPRRAFYQTSVQLFDAGTHTELWDEFDPRETPKWVNRRFGGAEQAWVSERVKWDEPYWDQSHGIYGAGRLFNGVQDSGVQTVLPNNARIVSFPGNRVPDQPEVQELHPWLKDHYK